MQNWNGPNADAYLLAVLPRSWLAAPGTNTYGRGGFFLYGGAVPGSAGCIDMYDRIVDVLTDIPRSLETVSLDVDYGHPFPPP
ncbi:MAG TPA: hypothetical protein VI670_14135 [Thermoanaerobaculia bacterium]